MKMIKNPEAFKLLADETRRKIVFLLRVKEMTVGQMGAELNVTPQAVYRHIKKLVQGDMVEIAREERIDHLIESYYRATAETFFCSVGKPIHSLEIAQKRVVSVLKALKTLGFNMELAEDKISKLGDVQREFEDFGDSEKFEDMISELDDVDFLTKQMVQKYAETLSMSDEEFARQQELTKEFLKLLRSLVKK